MPGALNARAALAQTGGESGGDPRAGLARVAAENHPGFGCRLAQGVAEGQADGEDGGWVEREFAGDGANAVGAEESAYGWCNRCCGHRLCLDSIASERIGDRRTRLAVASTRLVKAPSARRVVSRSPGVSWAVERIRLPASLRTRA